MIKHINFSRNQYNLRCESLPKMEIDKGMRVITTAILGLIRTAILGKTGTNETPANCLNIVGTHTLCLNYSSSDGYARR